MAIGIISSGIQDACDPAAALLMDHVHSDRSVMRVGSILGLGLAYANSKRETVLKNESGGVVFELKKVLTDTKPSATSEVLVATLVILIYNFFLLTAHNDAISMLVRECPFGESHRAQVSLDFLQKSEFFARGF